MPRGTRRTSYVRDGRGRFASTPGGGAPKRPPAKKASRGTNRLTRDNSGRITGAGKSGATARGGRLRTGAGSLRATQTDRLKGAPQGVLSRGGKVRGKVAAAKKPVGWMQSPEARKDRADPMVAGQRKDQAKRLRALPKAAQRAIRLERMNYGGTGANRMSAMRDIAEGRVILMGNVGKRKNKRSAGEVQAIAQQMNRSATRLKAGMATGSRGRMKYNPKAVEASGKGTAARKIRGARVGGVARKGKAAQPSRPDTAQANIPMRGARGRQLDASISRAVKEVQAAQRARLMKPKEQVRAEAAARKAAKEAAAAAKPARAPRSAQSLRISRAKQVEKRRSINISNPAGWRDDSAGRMAANAARTQQRALAFYGGKAKKKAVASNGVTVKSIKPGTGKAPKRISYLLAYHGTSKESAAAIRAGGYKETRFGTYGDGVYATTSRKAAREYAAWRAAGGKNKFGEAFPASALGPAVLTHRIPKGRMNKGDLPGYMISDWVKSGKARKVSKRATGHSPYVVMNEQLANRTLVNRSGTIRRSRKPRRPRKP